MQPGGLRRESFFVVEVVRGVVSVVVVGALSFVMFFVVLLTMAL